MGVQDAIDRALTGNRNYAQRTLAQTPELFATLSKGQSPEILWIGCADSRVPETTVCDCQPGEIFVHRNIANTLHANDLNSASVIEYAVGFLKVKHIVVCGHTSCGGAAASLGDADLGEVLNTWLFPVRELRRQFKAELEALPTEEERAIRLAELNVQRSVATLNGIQTVKKAIKERGLTVHGAIYDIATGELKVLDADTKGANGNYGTEFLTELHHSHNTESGSSPKTSVQKSASKLQSAPLTPPEGRLFFSAMFFASVFLFFP